MKGLSVLFRYIAIDFDLLPLELCSKDCRGYELVMNVDDTVLF